MNHKARCYQLGVLTCASAANRRLFFFFFAPVATPKESVFQGAPARDQQSYWRIAPGVTLKHFPCLLCFSKVPILFFFLSKSFVPVFIQPGKKPGHLRQVTLLIFQCHYPPNIDE